MLALTSTQGIVIAGIGVALAIVGIALAASRGRRKAAAPDIPSGMRPGPADPDLETPLLQKLQGWGVLLVVFLVVWIPATWIFEPSSNLDQEERLLEDAIARGRNAVQAFTEENQGGVGCVRCHGSELKGSTIPGTTPSGESVVIATPNLTTVCGGPFTGHPLIYGIRDIVTVLEQGRAPYMPSWSIRYAGALTDQRINDIVNYIVSIQDETQVPFDKNVCINPEAQDAAVDQFLDGDLSKKPSPTTNVQL
jgi:mono/diheme cytochrome c family protein